MSTMRGNDTSYEVTTRSSGREVILEYEDEHEMGKTQRVYRVDLVVLDLDV